MTTRSLLVSGVLFFSLLAAGLVWAEEPVKDVEPYVATFAYTPSTEKSPNSQGITVAVAKASFLASRTHGADADELWAYQLKVLGKADPSTGEMLWFAFPQFYNLSAGLRRGVAELLFAKGISVRGPYESYESIPAADKNAIDFYFIPKMKLVFTKHSNKFKRGDDTIDTNIEVSGTILLEAQNMTTRESLWTRTVSLEKIVFTSRMPSSGFSTNDRFNSIMNEVAKGIERQYQTLMSSVSGSIDSQEMRSLKEGVAASKGKTGY